MPSAVDQRSLENGHSGVAMDLEELGVGVCLRPADHVQSTYDIEHSEQQIIVQQSDVWLLALFAAIRGQWRSCFASYARNSSMR